MRCILKPAELPPIYVNVRATTRNEAIREMLGPSIAPAFFTLSAKSTFGIGYNSLWPFSEDPINFLAALPLGKQRTVYPIVGCALFIRCVPINDFSKAESDYAIADCTDADLDYVRKILLKPELQFKMMDILARSTTSYTKHNSMSNPYIATFEKLVERWRYAHSDAHDLKPLGTNCKIWVRDPASGNVESLLKSKRFRPNAFIQHCNEIGIGCKAPAADICVLSTGNAVWTIHHDNCCVTKLDQTMQVAEKDKKGKQKTIYRTTEHLAIPELDIFHLAHYLSMLQHYKIQVGECRI